MPSSTKHYPEVQQNPDFPAIEKNILEGWRQGKVFARSIENRAAFLSPSLSSSSSPPLSSSSSPPLAGGQGGNPSVKDSPLNPPASGGTSVNNEFVFYDGPPFANGLPHYGHLLTGFVKDAIARYQTMRGRRVERRFGWDCHGLPAEMGSEKELGISGRAAITEFGIGKFNEHCRTSVMKYTSEWEEYVTRQARWVDFKNDYKTMDKNFMESVLWAFKQLYDKGLVYEAYRVMPYSWAAETPLSNFETKLDNSYREREDKAITVAFELNTPPNSLRDFSSKKKIVVLAWTTTPWTLPSNLALAVAQNVEYVAVHGEERIYILSKKRYKDAYESLLSPMAKEKVPGEPIEPLHTPISGADLLGLSYKPLFPYFIERMKGTVGSFVVGSTPIGGSENAFHILDGSEFVTDEDGTGIVHMAPGFGEVDQKCCEANGIEVVVPVDGQGKFTDAIFDIPSSSRGIAEAGISASGKRSPNALGASEDDVLKLKGLNVIADTRKSEDEPYKEEQLKKFGLANLRIIKWLKDNKQLIKEEQIKHNYPHCWRTDQPLIYRAMPSWYVEVTKFRDRAVEISKQINWIPDHIRDGQMAHMLATAPDWSISRNRFWGTPIPVWKGDKGGIKVFGSIAELKEFFGTSSSRGIAEAGISSSGERSPNALGASEDDSFDLHRPFIDTLTKTDEHGETWSRVEDVFDCWFESGSMPFAQVHYPFENKDWFETHFPADFITEYVGQTRGWFNTLIMLSTALFDKPPFLNCICHGVVLDSETGLKYSKRLKNYKDPMEVMDKFGADSLRWLMLASPVMRGHDLAVDPEGKFIRDVVRLAIKPIWNAYNFFCLYANADGVIASSSRGIAEAGISASSTRSPTSLDSVEDDMHLMDRYILAKCSTAVATIQKSLDAYDTPTACDAVMQFFEVLNNWYIRRSKERFWKEEKDADKQAAYDTLYTVLTTMCRAAAPLLPLTLDAVYKGLTGEESVHLASFPTVTPALRGGLEPQSKSPEIPAQGGDDELIADMDRVQDICNAALGIRNKQNIRVRQPLTNIQIVTNSNIAHEWKKKYGNSIAEIIKSEINVKEILEGDMYVDDFATARLSINSQVLGKRLPEKMKQILPASKKGEWVQKEGVVEIAGEKLLPAEYTLQLEPKPEYANRAQALSTNDALVILDITITEELKREGLARDLVRAIQQARKDAGLQVTDRIELGIAGDIADVLADADLLAYIKDQTLATGLQNTALTAHIFESKVALDELAVTITLKRSNG